MGGPAQPRSPARESATGIHRSTSQRSRDLVEGGASEVWDAKRDENPGLRRPLFLVGIADGLDCAKGLRRSRCNCPGGLTTRNGGFSLLKRPMIPPKLARPASVP